MSIYSRRFYDGVTLSAKRSAEVIVPILMDLLAPRSVVDVGCGPGQWLATFREHGVEDVLGVDGGWVPSESLQIPSDRFFVHDLTKPLALGRKFDLVTSLEVAEHLDEATSEQFVSSLVGLGPVVAFSAAIPFQGGTHHINEQWPDFWGDLFQKHRYVAVDCVRKLVWDNDRVDFFYAQNLLLFADEQFLAGSPGLARAYEENRRSNYSLVHPRMYLLAVERGRVFRNAMKPCMRALKTLLRPAYNLIRPQRRRDQRLRATKER